MDWQALRTPLGLPGQRQAVAMRTSFVALRADLPPKPPHVRFYVTSAGPRQVAPERLATLVRQHWKIENSLHHVKDRTWLEDRHWVGNRRTGAAVTMLRSVACCLVRGARGHAMQRRPHCPARIEYFNQHPTRALRILSHPLRL